MKKLSLVILLIGLAACGQAPNSKTPSMDAAAAQLEQAFANAPAPAKAVASEVSDSLKKKEYEKAVVSMTTIRANPAVTPEQFQAIQDANIALQNKLIEAAEAGDQNAQRAYLLYKEMRRK